MCMHESHLEHLVPLQLDLISTVLVRVHDNLTDTESLLFTSRFALKRLGPMNYLDCTTKSTTLYYDVANLLPSDTTWQAISVPLSTTLDATSRTRIKAIVFTGFTTSRTYQWSNISFSNCPPGYDSGPCNPPNTVISGICAPVGTVNSTGFTWNGTDFVCDGCLVPNGTYEGKFPDISFVHEM